MQKKLPIKHRKRGEKKNPPQKTQTPHMQTQKKPIQFYWGKEITRTQRTDSK